MARGRLRLTAWKLPGEKRKVSFLHGKLTFQTHPLFVRKGMLSGSPTVREGVVPDVTFDALPHGRASATSHIAREKFGSFLKLTRPLNASGHSLKKIQESDWQRQCAASHSLNTSDSSSLPLHRARFLPV